MPSATFQEVNVWKTDKQVLTQAVSTTLALWTLGNLMLGNRMLGNPTLEARSMLALMVGHQ